MNFVLWLIFGLLTPFLWAFNNVFDKALVSRLTKNEYSLTFLSCMTRLPIFFLLWWLSGWNVPDKNLMMLAFAAGFLNILPIVFYYKALKKGETANVVLLYDALNPIFVLILGFSLLGERLSVFDGIGFAFLLLAGMLSSVRLGGKFILAAYAFWIAIAALLWAFPDILFEHLVSKFDSAISLLAWSLVGGFFAGFVLMAFPQFHKNCRLQDFKYSKTAWLIILIGTIIVFIGNFTFLKALELERVSLTVVLSNTQPLFVFALELILARLLFKLGIFGQPDLSRKSLLPKIAAFVSVLAGIWFLQM